MALGVLDVDNVERAGMSLPVNHGTHSPQVTASGDHAQVACKIKSQRYVHNFNCANIAHIILNYMCVI